MANIQADEIRRNVPLAAYTTLKAGGPAERFFVARTVEQFAAMSIELQSRGQDQTILGWGSNVLPSDDGVPGLCTVNQAQTIQMLPDGQMLVESGVALQDVFLKAAQSNLSGLEFAVGIPGSIGGALVSNAGAYRSEISKLLVEIEIVEGANRRWVAPDWMEFSYRNSKLRRAEKPACALLAMRLQLSPGNPKQIFDQARDYQRQRIGKQPPSASAGSFFKNVEDKALAQEIPGLTDGMRANGVVPSGFLIEAVGLKGFRLGGAQLSARHANFIVNVGRATATEIRSLAMHAAEKVYDRFGVTIEEEVLYIGDWSRFERIKP